MVDDDKEEAQDIESSNGVFFEGICGTGGTFCRPAKGSLSDNVGKDRHSSTGVGGPVESTLERAGEGLSGVEVEGRAGGSWIVREGLCFFDLRPIAEAIEFKEILVAGFERDHQLLEEESGINNK